MRLEKCVFPMTAPYGCPTVCHEIVRRYQEGESAVTIGRVLGVDPGAVFYRLVKHGVQRRQQGAQGARDPQRSALRRDEVARLRESGQTLEQIGAALKISRERARQILNSAGVDTSPTPREHQCGDACAAVLAAVPPVRLSRLTAAAGIGYNRLLLAAHHHGIRTGGVTHECTARCAILGAALSEGASISEAARRASVGSTYVHQNFPAYHPEWNWSRKRTVNRIAEVPA